MLKFYKAFKGRACKVNFPFAKQQVNKRKASTFTKSS